MKFLKLLILMACICLIDACTEELTPDELSINSEDSNLLKSGKKPVRIAIVSDIHYLDQSLLKNNASTGTAFLNYLMGDPKLIEFSASIFEQVVSELQADKPDLLLIPGDLTKDGEKISHKAMAKILQNLSKSGIKVFVIPGNHDVNNPESRGYDGNTEFITPSVSSDEFSSIYEEFGYKKAKERDPNSLTYICEPYSKLWILGIDDCKYDQVRLRPEVSGVIKPETMEWIQEKLKLAKKDKITVLAMMHHGILEHYQNQELLDKGYVTDNWTSVGKELMEAGVQIMFTGHYHANDITMTSEDGNILYDIETGSLVTAPCPYRMITLVGKEVSINTRKISTINYPIPGGLSFTTYSTNFLSASMDGYFSYMLAGMGLDASTIAFVAPRFRNAIMAHYSGDEQISELEQAYVNMLAGNAFLYGAVTSLWNDLLPADNEYHLTLK